MNALLIGNILSFIGCGIMVLGGFIKKKERILSVQCVQFVIQAAANLTLGAKNGFVCGIVSLVRNLVFSKVKTSVSLKLFFMALQLVLSVKALSTGLIELMPLLGGWTFTWFLDSDKEEVLKKAIIASQVMWLVYDFSFQNYAGSVFDFLTICSNIAGIIMLRKAAVYKDKE